MKLIKLNAIDSTNEYIKKIKSHVSDKFFVYILTVRQTVRDKEVIFGNLNPIKIYVFHSVINL